MKKSSLLIMICIFAMQTHAQNFNVNRFYGDVGFHFGGSHMFKDYYPNVNYNNGSGGPQGLYASLTIANDRYLARARGSFS